MSKTEEKNTNTLSGMKILYVEDEDEARTQLAKILKRRAGKVVAVSNGKDGLKKFFELNPDIILTDLFMPGTSGIEMIEQIRMQTSRDDYSIIAISAAGDAETIIKTVDAGIDKYIIKPISPDELLQALNEQAEVVISKRKNRNSEVVLDHKKMEDEIKREFAALLKTLSGKGPRDVMTYIGGERIEITVTGVLTPMEKTMFDKDNNNGIIKYTREMFFSITADDFCQMLKRITGRRSALKETRINVAKDTIQLVFSIEAD